MDYPIWTLFIYIYLSSTYINRLRYILLLTFILSLTTTIISQLYSVFSVSVFLSIYIGSFPAESRYQTCVSRQLRKLLYDLIYFFNIVNPNVPMSPLGNTSKLFTVHITDSSLY